MAVYLGSKTEPKREHTSFSMFPTKEVGDKGRNMQQGLKGRVQVTRISKVLQTWGTFQLVGPCGGDGILLGHLSSPHCRLHLANFLNVSDY